MSEELSEETKELMEEEGRAGDRETAAKIAEIRADEEAGSLAKQSREDRAAERETTEEEYAQKGVHVSSTEAIHGFFGLTYANYLVVNRSLLQSMPLEWQEDFVELLGELNEEMGWAQELQPAIEVRILKRPRERIEEREDCDTCDGEGTDPQNEDEPCPECDGECSFEGEEREETAEEIGIITDPIAHYERGRAYVPRLSDSIADVEDSHVRMFGEWLKAKDIEEWRKRFGPEFEPGAPVMVLRNVPSHILPPIMLESECKGVFDGEIIEPIDHCLYKVKVAIDHSEDPEMVDVQLHSDQLESVG